jgi:hypothetical protein
MRHSNEPPFPRQNRGYRLAASFNLLPEYRAPVQTEERLISVDRDSIVGRVALDGGIIQTWKPSAASVSRIDGSASTSRKRCTAGRSRRALGTMKS